MAVVKRLQVLPSPSSEETAMTPALLREVATALCEHQRDGVTRVIDLRSLPMSDGDREALTARLGRGEVEITLSVAGKSEIWETSYAGVWWVRHIGADGRPLTESIEITPMPRVAMSPAEDMRAASERLTAELEEAS